MGLFDYRTYIIDQKLLSIQHTLIIKDEKQTELGKAVKKILSVTEEIDFNDNTKPMQTVGSCKRKLLAAFPAYEVENELHQTVANIKKQVIAIGDDWWVEDTSGKKVLKVDGNLIGLEYTIRDMMNQKVAEVSKKFFSIRDSYGVKITGNDADPFIILAVVAAIDLEKYKKEKKI
ncbi:MAG: hypothetical protein WED07_00865 [Candidatus Freyarchaeum deiterrae]